MTVDAEAGLRGLGLKPVYSSGSDDLLAGFYVPALSRAVSYDRIAGYFASSSFVSAAAGLARFINGGGFMRLIVGAQLSESDCSALRGDVTLDEVLAERLSVAALVADDVARRRLEVIAWLVREERLEMRVGVPCGAGGRPLAVDDPDNDGRYFHAKSGILRDRAADEVVFSGSINESSQGWQRNFEQFNVYPSWKAEAWFDYGRPETERFERLWRGETDSDWQIVALPDAFRQDLLELVEPDYVPPDVDPAEPAAVDIEPGDGDPPLIVESPEQAHRLSESDRASIAEIRDAPLSATGVGLVSAGVQPWPHQLNIARRILDTWPRSYLLADQVGLGKTIEVGLVLRELLLSGRASRALILVPASVLIQWQQELDEKFCLDVPRLDGNDVVFSQPGRRRPVQTGTNPWSAEPVLLASSHLARRREQRSRLLAARGWDLVVLDEAHHARRGGSKPDSTPNQMLALLQELAQQRKFETLLLASATPMQMHPHELWDLLALFGLPEHWDRSSEAMQRYYEQLAEPFKERNWDLLRRMAGAHLAVADEPSDRRINAALATLGPAARHRIQNFAHSAPNAAARTPPTERPAWDEWLRACTPVRDRVFRTTRTTLKTYQHDDLLPAGTVIPERVIDDCFNDLGEAQELYERIDGYIAARYERYRAGSDSRSRALGFIMTVYRRRLTSSFHAIRCSLQRRRSVLEDRDALADLLDDDDRHAAEEALSLDADDLDLTASRASELDDELAEIDRFIADLDTLPPDEPKMQRLAAILADGFSAGHRNAVVFTQYADTLRYIRRRLLHTYRNGLACYYGGTGEMWDEEAGVWVVAGKEQIKSRFRRGEVQILIGTDSMSEGLNLQTSRLMVNFDMPWNFARVEQRIGRLDRIGGQPLIEVHNLYYSDTVEMDVYAALRDRFGNFEAVLGSTSPVLAEAENALREAAMGVISAEQAARRIESSAQRAEGAAVRVEHLDAVPEPSTELRPAMTLQDLRDRLLSIPAVAALLPPDPERDGVWRLSRSDDRAVTFDRRACADHDDVALLTWSSPLLEDLLGGLAAGPA